MASMLLTEKQRNAALFSAGSAVLPTQRQQSSAALSQGQNNGGVFGGIGYLGHKVGLGFLSGVEGIWDYAASGIAKLFGEDEWAERQVANDWVNYNSADEWFDPGEGWKVAGDVAGGVGTSLPSLAAVGIGAATIYFSGGTLSAPGTKMILAGISGLTAGLAAAGNATKEAYRETGELTGKEYGYGAMVGATEAAIEAVSGKIGTGTGRIIKGIADKTVRDTAKNVAKTVAKKTAGTVFKNLAVDFAQEAFEEAAAEIMSPIYKRLTYNPDAENATPQEIGYAALIGGLSGIVMSGAHATVNTSTNFLSGNNLVKNNKAASVMETAKQFAESEAAHDTGIAAWQNVRTTYEALQGTMAETGGEIRTARQKMLLGELNKQNAVAAIMPEVERSARNMLANPEAVAKAYTEFGMKDADGNAVTFTAEQIREGVDMSDLSSKEGQKRFIRSLRKALTTNSVLSTLSIADATGHLMMDTVRFSNAEQSALALASSTDLNRFIEQASEQEKAALGKRLGIEDWSMVTHEQFQAAVRENLGQDGGAQLRSFAEQQQRVKAAMAEPLENARPVPHTLRRNMNDGVYRFSDESAQMAVIKEGESYYIVDYDTHHISNPLAVSDVNRVLKQVRDGASARAAASVASVTPMQESASVETSAPAERLAIGRTAENKPFVEIENDILDGVPENEWARTVKKNLAAKFPNGVQLGRGTVKINQASRQEMTFSKYMQWLKANDPQAFSDKLRATDNADEILQATTGWISEGLKHPRADSITDFARGTVLLRVGKNDYSAEVIVGSAKDGTMMMYDIINLTPTTITKKEMRGAITSDPSREADRKTPRFSDNSITETAEKSNTFSEKSAEENASDGKKRADFLETKAIDAWAKENVPDYNKLAENARLAVRATIRRARAHGIAEADVKLYANVAAHSGLDVVFDVTTEGDGLYDMRNTIYVDPNAPAERIRAKLLLHEGGHALFWRTKKGKKLLHDAAKMLDAKKAKEITDRYTEYYEKKNVPKEKYLPIIEEEIAAAALEDVLGSTDAWEYILAEDPQYESRLISFFAKAAQDYKHLKDMPTDARKLMRQYKTLFQELSARNQGNNATDTRPAVETEKSATRMNDENMQVTEKRLAIAYDEAIDQLDRGNLDTQKNTHLKVLDHTPDIYIEKAGASNHEIVMAWDVTYLAMKKDGDIPGHYHGLGADVMKALPGALEDPLYIIKQKNGRIAAVTKIIVKGKRAVFASIELETFKTTIQDGATESKKYNLVVTVTDAKPNYLQNTVFGGEIVHNKNDEDPANFILRLKSLEKAAPTYDLARSSKDSITDSNEKSNPKSKKLLENRVSGDDLLNARDLIADVKALGGEVDENGYLTLYHRTSTENAKSIRSTGQMIAKEDGLFFSTKQNGQNVGYGDAIVTFKIPAEKLVLDDVFDDEAHLRYPLNKPGRVSVDEYLLEESKPQTSADLMERHALPETEKKQTSGKTTGYTLQEITGEKLTAEEVADFKKTLEQKVGVERTKYKVGAKEFFSDHTARKDFVFTRAIGVYIDTVDELAGVSYFLKNAGGVRDAAAIVNVARSSISQAQTMISHVQYDLFAEKPKKLGKGLQKILSPVMPQIKAFNNYLLNYLNIDRMSLEARSRAKQTALEERLGAISEKIKVMEKNGKKVPDQMRAEQKATKEALAAFVPMKNKPLFNKDGEIVTAKQSENLIAEYEHTHTEFKKVAEEIWAFFRNLNKMRVDAGLISQADFDRMQELYPHYVPAYRDVVDHGKQSDAKTLAVNKTVKRAVGGTPEIVDILQAGAEQVQATIRAAQINRIAAAIADAAEHSGSKAYVEIVSREKSDRVGKRETEEGGLELRPKDNQIIFFRNGEKITMQVSDEIFKGFEGLYQPTVELDSFLLRTINRINSGFKKLVTSWSPAFAIRNPIRDLQDAGINSRHPALFVKNMPIAVRTIARNGEQWQQYCAMGGFSASVFGADGIKASVGERGFETLLSLINKNDGKINVKEVLQVVPRAGKNLLTLVENINAFVEQIPRFTEYLAAIEAGENVAVALNNSAEVTTNFGRRGRLTKKLNATIMPFLNPAIQGFDKIFRNVKDAVSGEELAKGIAALISKLVLIGILPTVLNALLYEDDEDYQMLDDAQKENNFLLKVGDVFVKIPRGRVASVIGGAANRVRKSAKGEDADWGGYFSNVVSQVTPVENMTRTIFSPVVDISTNTTWYGSAIEGRQFENTAPRDRYDESTSDIAIALGQAFNYSPKKIHYLLDQYSGVIGDFVLPATTSKAEKDFFSGNFTIDPVTSNKLSDEFYELLEEAQYAKTAGDDTAIYQVRYFNRTKDAINKMYDEISKIQQSDLSDVEKLQQTRVIRALINEAYKTAMQDYALFTEAAEATKPMAAMVDGEGISERTFQNLRFTEASRLVYGAKYALEVWDESVFEKATLLNGAGVSYDTYYDYYFALRNITSDVDRRGNVIAGSKRKKVVAAINAMNVPDEQKLLLICAQGYSLQDGDLRRLSATDAKKRLLRYILSLKVSKAEKEEMAKMCGFEVKNGRIIAKTAFLAN